MNKFKSFFIIGVHYILIGGGFWISANGSLSLKKVEEQNTVDYFYEEIPTISNEAEVYSIKINTVIPINKDKKEEVVENDLYEDIVSIKPVEKKELPKTNPIVVIPKIEKPVLSKLEKQKLLRKQRRLAFRRKLLAEMNEW